MPRIIPAIILALSTTLAVDSRAQAAPPEIFAPGVISGPASDLSPAFSPDGQTVFFTRSNPAQSTILVSHLKGGRWSVPEVAPFSGEWRDLEPTMAPDGSYLIFASNRPPTAGGAPLDGMYNGATQPSKGGNLWRVDRAARGWSQPRRLADVINSNSSVFSPSVTADGTLYFMQPSGAQSRFHIFRSPLVNGSYSAPIPVEVSAGEAIGDFDPAVAPDGSFMVFSSARLPANGTSLFIARRQNGAWSTPEYMGAIASPPGTNNIEARLGSDPRTLYFSSARVVAPPARTDRSSAERNLDRLAAWDNGLPNIWQLSLAPWLSTGPVPETRTASAPRIIGAGVISTPAEEFKATIAPDRRTLAFVSTDRLFRHATIVLVERDGADWRRPVVAPFSGIWRDADPSFAPDGRTLLFISNRPFPREATNVPRRDYAIWRVQREADGRWGEPAPLGPNINGDTATYSPSMTASGTLYFSRGEHIFRAVQHDSGFDAPVALPFDGGDPSISADERFLVFESEGPTAGNIDRFISCRAGTGWSPPSRFAEPVNSPSEEGDASIAADGRTIYFFSRRVAPRERAPRAHRATYDDVKREAFGDVLNGSRNLFEVDLATPVCAGPRRVP